MREYEAKELLKRNNLPWEDFKKWMVGQTLSRDEDGNELYHSYDVHRYISIKKRGGPDIFD